MPIAFHRSLITAFVFIAPNMTTPIVTLRWGGLVEAMRWLTDKVYVVQKVTCLNTGGDACRFRVPKTPAEYKDTNLSWCLFIPLSYRDRAR